MNTGRLLEHYRQEAHFSALEKLASHNHLIEQSQTESEFLALVNQLHAQTSDAQLDQLLEKSRHEGLSQEEKQLLTKLLGKNPD